MINPWGQSSPSPNGPKGGGTGETGERCPKSPDPAFGTQEMVENFAFILDTSAAAWAFWCFNWQFTGSLLRSRLAVILKRNVSIVVPWWILQVNLMDWFQGYRIANHSIEARSGSSQIFCLLVVGSNPWKSFIRGSCHHHTQLKLIYQLYISLLLIDGNDIDKPLLK